MASLFEGQRQLYNAALEGYPRFRSAVRWDSVEYPQTASWKITERSAGPGVGRLYLQGVGHVACRGSRRGVVGTPKTLVIRREGRRYRAFVVGEVEAPALMAPTAAAVGIDRGVTHLLATSDGELVDNPRHIRNARARAQARVSARQRGSQRRRKAGMAVGAISRRVARQRRDHLHKLSRALVDRYDLIVVEDLRIRNMVRRPKPVPNPTGGYDPNVASAKSGLNREILSASWGVLLSMIAYKAAEAGRTMAAVDPRGSSQTCHLCGQTDRTNRSGTEFCCVRCGHQDHADIKAARNILRAGLALRLKREAPRVA